MKKFIVIFFLFAGPACLAADAVKEADAPAGREEHIVAPLPILFYTPETSLLFGVTLLYFIETPNSYQGKNDTYSLYGVYTLKNQLIAGFTTETYLGGKDWLVKGASSFSRFPDRYFGYGPHTSLQDEEKYTPMQFRVTGTLMRRIWKDFYIGPRFEEFYYSISRKEPNGKLAVLDVPGKSGGLCSGFGAEAKWDSRDNPFYPASGIYTQIRYTHYGRYLGSRYNFYSVVLDHRQYFSFYENHVIAFQYFMCLGNGDTPFPMMAMLGGAALLRGYYMGRYRDRNLVAAQLEYRFPVWWRFGGAIFGGAGQVAHTPGGLDLRDMKVAGGAGLRFMMHEEKKINYRVDFALYDTRVKVKDKDAWGIYLSITEAY